MREIPGKASRASGGREVESFYRPTERPLVHALFRCKVFLDFDIIVFLFVFDKYYSIIN